MRKGITTALIALLVLTSQASSVAAFDQSSAISYLKSQVVDEWSVMALASASALGGVSLNFLSSDPGGKATDIEKRILARHAAGLDDGGLADRLARKFSGTEIGAGDGLLTDDIFGLLALSAVRKKPRIRRLLAEFIKQNQNPDGGWGFAHSPTSSDSNDTAMAVMALIAQGESADSKTIKRAFNYINTTKTTSGYAFNAGFGADTASTAWVLSAFYSAGRTPSASAVRYLQGQQKANGSFAWQSESSGSPLMTSYAVVALNQDFYPLKETPIQIEDPSGQGPIFQVAVVNSGHALYLDEQSFSSASVTDNTGKTHSFDSPVAIGTVVQTGLPHIIKDTSLGLFVESIAGINPADTRGWMYAVNGNKPSAGSADFTLKNGDRIIWFFDDFNASPPAFPGNNNNSNPEPEQARFGASNARVNLTVDIVNPEPEANLNPPPGPVLPAVDEKPAIIFGVDKSSMDFGTLEAGRTSRAKTVTLINGGQVNLEVASTLENADAVYHQGLLVSGKKWDKYKGGVFANSRETARVQLAVPNNYTGTGKKTGTLIFWAKAR